MYKDISELFEPDEQQTCMVCGEPMYETEETRVVAVNNAKALVHKICSETLDEPLDRQMSLF